MGKRERYLASLGFAVHKQGRTCRDAIIDGGIGCSSYEIVVTEILRGLRKGSSLLVLDFRRVSFYLFR